MNLNMINEIQKNNKQDANILQFRNFRNIIDKLYENFQGYKKQETKTQ